MKVERKRIVKNISITGGVLVLLFAVTLFISSDIGKYADRIQKKKTDFAFQGNAIESLALLKEGSKEALNSISLLQNLLPERDQLINLPKDLGRIARRHSLSFDFRFGSESPGTDALPGTVSIQLSVTGAYSDFLNFLREMRRSNYLIRIDSFDFSGEAPSYQVRMDGLVYIR
ncbi:MAG: hypothetical protein COU08_02075 [Candidatus Harrisonbacteria bacterium CG10_big_fil_rev_8_21_14_0_10_42_17]|uniref:Type 4 fimbrial biogenesis protein PilO n=1 Tax=Candidatus Harrisonbacteria bacterium CG10_big_fil_rev_8_21_14_0_10_42_17 TaxID=1974584 RepID=A0A2M6WIC2_9BACT|nr:MAG: hypothetical protein COU08_02075 [Candidatus Harrisonbacteria bacterium CG10_big_fil_rev_8_21_14_0_10_42_17]